MQHIDVRQGASPHQEGTANTPNISAVEPNLVQPLFPRRTRSLLLSRSRTRDSSTRAKKSLLEEIWGQLSESTFNDDRPPQKYLAEGLLDGIVTKESVRKAFRHSWAERELITFVTEKSKKVFIILHSDGVKGKDLVKYMRVFERQKVQDTDLPLKKKNKIFEHLGWNKDSLQVSRFCNERQWLFLAPVISTARKHTEAEYRLPKATILPLVAIQHDNQQAYNKSFFAQVYNKSFSDQVYKYGIHPMHFNDAEQLVSFSDICERNLIVPRV